MMSVRFNMLLHNHLKLFVYFGLLFWKTDNAYSRSFQIENHCENKSSNILIDLLNVAEDVLYSAKQYAKLKTSSRFEYPLGRPMDCAEIYERDAFSKSGIYEVFPRSRVTKSSVYAYCDMDDEGGAWTVIQRRGDFGSPKDYFYRDWISYKYGFGDPLKDFWLGNDFIFALTNKRACTLKFSLSDWDGNTTYATYDEFWIDDEDHNYTSHVSGYRGNAGDSFSFTNGTSFSTKDRDNDKYNASSCAVMYSGAWWYAACHSSNLNGLYLKGKHESYANGVEWSSFKGQKYSLKDTIIKIRPRDFRKTLT